MVDGTIVYGTDWTEPLAPKVINCRVAMEALKRDGIDVASSRLFWTQQYRLWQSGVRDSRMHDNALATFSTL
jgi:hypothetical protein